ncbi:MAG: repressor LexA [Dehalococcoidales bacterium]|nr:MAG: repressor LexA [Dehalococcoidales bacterium]
MRRSGLSKTRERIYTFIRKFYREHDYAPTVRDILRGCRLSSTAVVQYHLNVLEKEGRIHRDPEVFRSIRLADKPGISSVPLLGTVAAGEPIPVPTAETWTSQALEIMEVPEEITEGKQLYALKVKGFSMIDALIDDGDTVLMEPANTAEDGDMVAVWLKNEQEVTLKRFYREGETVCLRPANKLMEPIYQYPENVEIQGKVSAVLRKL